MDTVENGVETDSAFRFDMGALFRTFCANLNSESYTLLLYTLLHRNEHVRAYFMARTDIELMVS